ncbi:MAG TPA: zinc ABC transporter substrate-binding protein [Fimbriiglobus sp.]|nr:zinc ABC transporter substrate-binding protein [Fimbriiglobus sp.]
MKAFTRVRLVGYLLLAGGTGLAPVGCAGGGPGPIGNGPVQVTVTTSVIADTVRQVGGSHVRVTALMGPGVDPHTYLPSPSDAVALASAHIVFFNGLHLEGKMTQLLEENQAGTARAVPVSRAIDPARLRHADSADGAHDPHVWFDVRLWMTCVEVVRDELSALDPARAADYRANADRYLKELDALDREVREKAAKLPSDRRVLVTSHDAFGYFGRAYGFEVHGLQGVSTAAATGTRDISDLATFLGRRQIPAVFCETSVPSKGLESVLNSVRNKYQREVRLVGGADALYSDALGEPGTPGESYVGMVRHNIDVIVRALSQ